MASIMASQRVGAQILQLPPSIRVSIFQQSIAKRSFSTSNARRADLTTIVASGPAAVLDTLHALMPWYIAIPTAAVLVRGIVGYHLSSLPARKAAITRMHLFPLWNFQAKHAWMKYREALFRKMRETGNVTISPASQGIMFFKKGWINWRASHEVGKTYGAPLFTWRSFFNFGMMIAFTEALRIKCGSREGLLPIILHPIEWAKSAIADPIPDANADTTMESMLPEEILAQRLEMAQEAKRVGGELPEGVTDAELLDYAQHLSSTKTSEYAAYLDPTLQAEGLSWCPDLTAIDPTFTMPFALSLTIAATAFFRPAGKPQQPDDKSHKELNKEQSPESTPQPPQPTASVKSQTANHLQAALEEADRIKAAAPVKDSSPFANLTFRQRITLTFSMLFLIMAVKLPAALLLYLVPSFVVGALQRKWLDLKYPMPKPIHPSKRPMRIKVKKTLGEV